MNMWKRWFVGAVSAVLLAGSVSSAALAFDDVGDAPQAAKIMELKERGIVSGFGDGTFAPRGRMTAQQAIPLIVRALELSLAKYTFIKQPLASDSFTNIPDDAWYAEAFVIAHVNGVPIDRDIDPNDVVSREQFVLWLMSALETTGDYAWIEIYHSLQDEKDVSEGFMDAIQKALIAGVAELDENGNFRPGDAITRGEAAVMVRNAIAFVEKSREPAKTDPIEIGDVTASVVTVNDEIRKVVLDMGERPHPGWSVRIEGIDFADDDTAVVRYSVSYPDPAAFYPAVLAHPKAETYLSADYTDIGYEFVGNGASGHSVQAREPLPR